MTDTDAMNDWELGSGLDLDGAKVEITGCEFGFNNALGAGVLCANMTFTPIEGGDDMEQSFSVGKGWEVDRTGENLVPDGGKKRKLNMTSNFGRLLTSAMDCLAGDQENGESDSAYQERRIEVAAEVLGSPRHAPNWVGTMWEVGSYTRTTMNPTTKAEKESIGFIFTAYLGDGIGDGAAEEEPTKAKGAAKAAAGKSSTTRAGGRTGGKVGKKADGPPTGVDEDLWTQLVDLAIETMNGEDDNDHEDFVDAAMEVDGVDGNKAAQKAIMGSGAGSVWAAATAKNK